MTVVVNIRHEKCDVKICRKPDNTIPPPPEFGCLGNPYPVEKYGRHQCIEMYKDYFLKRIENDPEFRKHVLSLRGKKLGCFCKPLACHGDVIVEWLENNHE